MYNREGFIENILAYVELHKDQVPYGYYALHKKKIENVGEVLVSLAELFTVEESEIEKMRLKASAARDYEDAVRKFAIPLVKILLSEFRKLRKHADYRMLMGQKHVAYAFFHVLNTDPSYTNKKFDYSELYEEMYLGLVEFYNEFYGHFRDNEEAIELLCKYYSKTINNETCKYKIASALYRHISKAGTPGDLGYAYQGIGQIEKYIGELPVSIIMEVLKLYQAVLIGYNRTYRHQVHAIILHSQISEDQKSICKFRFLDSIVLIAHLHQYLARKMEEQLGAMNVQHVAFGWESIMDDIKVLEEPDVHWSNGELGERDLLQNGRSIFRIGLRENKKIEFSKIKKGGDMRSLLFPYSYTDWLLEDYDSKESEQKLAGFISGAAIIYRRMNFSLLYINGHRGIKSRTIDFDHQFQYDKENKALKRREERSDDIRRFYGKSVYSLSCIVGRNGMGKTSIVDFLRESFFRILILIGNNRILCKQGYVRKEDCFEYGILDKETEFLVVFKLDDRPFFLTNIADVKIVEAEPFREGIYNSWNELSKIAYFSNMLNNNQKKIFHEDSVAQDSRSDNKEKQEIGRSLIEFHQADYSETESFIRKRKAVDQELERQKIWAEQEIKGDNVNREICYQLTFLRNTNAKKLCKCLDIEENTVFWIMSWIKGEKRDQFTLADLRKPEKINYLEEKYLFLPDAQIHYFSSGQYAKFAFLAKLHWFLRGYREEILRYREIVGENEFQSNNALLNGESALIFIDEGETYYHPEWQRRYIKTLLEMINYEENESEIQIVLTTNSPFILSDILQEDVTYLTVDSAEDKEAEFDRTLGQNIHKLLKQNFFMDYTIGEYARELIEKITMCLQNPNEEQHDGSEEMDGVKADVIVQEYFGEEKEVYDAVRQLINQIGEPVYRYELERLLDESHIARKRKNMERLLAEKKRIEEEIKELEKEMR